MQTQLRTIHNRTLATLALTMALTAPALAGGGYEHAHPGHAFHAYHGMDYAHPHGMQGRSSGCPYIESGMARAPAKTLGVMVSSLPNATLDELGLGYGILVSGVQTDSAAAVAGIRSGDLILEYGGKPVYSGDRLRWLVSQTEVGKAVEIKLLRGEEMITLNGTLTEVAAPVKEQGQYEHRKMGRQT